MAKNTRKAEVWTAEKIAELREHYPVDSWDDLCRRFNASKECLATIAWKNDIKRECVNYAFYSSHEDEMIVEYYNQGYSDKEIAELMPWRTASSINTRRSRIGAVQPQTWSMEEDQMLRNLYHTMPAKDLEIHLPGRSRNSIVAHAKKLGLVGYRDYDYYTEKDYEFIRNNYLVMSDEEMGSMLNHSKDSIKNKRNKLGLHRVDKSKIHYETFDVYFRRHNNDWKNESMRNCRYKCVITGERFDDIHHLVSQNTIISNVMERWNIDPSAFDINTLEENERELFLQDVLLEQAKYPYGLCLRHDVHKHFHDLYGYGDNTTEQFIEFVERFYPGVQLNIA